MKMKVWCKKTDTTLLWLKHVNVTKISNSQFSTNVDRNIDKMSLSINIFSKIFKTNKKYIYIYTHALRIRNLNR